MVWEVPDGKGNGKGTWEREERQNAAGFLSYTESKFLHAHIYICIWNEIFGEREGTTEDRVEGLGSSVEANYQLRPMTHTIKTFVNFI